jgi:hypothetical protein
VPGLQVSDMIINRTEGLSAPPLSSEAFMRSSGRQVGFSSFLLLTVFLIALTAQAQKIHVTYDKAVNFANFKTFGWAPRSAIAHPMLAADVVGAIEDELTARGLQKATSNPDLIIQVYGSIDNESTFYSNDPLYMGSGGIPPLDPSMTGPAFVGDWGNNTVTIHKGDMIVDLIQASTKKLAWRAMSQENVSTQNPEKLMQEVNNTISKMFKEYPVKK